MRGLNPRWRCEGPQGCHYPNRTWCTVDAALIDARILVDHRATGIALDRYSTGSLASLSFEPGHRAAPDERTTGFEPATSTLARWRATNCATST
jgi:hypothetical protein